MLGTPTLAESERRVKLVDVSERDVVDFFAFGLSERLPECITLPLIGKLPPGSRLLRAAHDPWLRVFRFLVTHPSFPEVPDGQMPPSLSPPPGGTMVILARPIPVFVPDTAPTDRPHVLANDPRG